MEQGTLNEEGVGAHGEWLRLARAWFPVGSRVRVIVSDLDYYIGTTGVVIGYDISVDCEPLVSVQFDVPQYGEPDHDGFYDDEIRPEAM